MLNYELQIDQERLNKEAEAARETEADRNTDLYDKGDCDGGAGVKPNREKMLFQAYRQGYADGINRYWLKRYEIEIEIPI